MFNYKNKTCKHNKFIMLPTFLKCFFMFLLALPFRDLPSSAPTAGGTPISILQTFIFHGKGEVVSVPN
jgi:hypothetical protein